MRADRLNIKNKNFYLLTETSTQIIFQEIKKLKPDVVIVDSVQTLQSNLIDASQGSISQIKECAGEFQRYGFVLLLPAGSSLPVHVPIQLVWRVDFPVQVCSIDRQGQTI